MKKEFFIGTLIGAILVVCIVLAMNNAFAMNDENTMPEMTNIVNVIRVILDKGDGTEIKDFNANEPEIEIVVEDTIEMIEETTEQNIIYLTLPVRTDEESTVEEIWKPEERDVIAMAKLLYGECRGVKSRAEQAAVAWCVLNRFDNPRFGGETIYDVITAKNQFMGYKESNPVTNDLRELAEDVLNRWHREKMGESPVGRTLPKDYVYFVGRDGHNWFSAVWKSGEYFDFNKLATNPYNN